MNDLHAKYGNRGLSIVAIPSHEFNQEYKNNAKIENFVKSLGVEFTVTEPMDVNGSPLFEYLKESSGHTKKVRWNFSTKWIVDRTGQRVVRVDARDCADAEKVILEFLNLETAVASQL